MNIVVFRLGSWSDTILSNFVVPALKDKFPGAKVALVVSKSLTQWGPSLQADEILTLDEGKLNSSNFIVSSFDASKMALALRSQKFDLGLSLNGTWRIGAIMKAAGVKKSVGLQNRENSLRLGKKVMSGFDKSISYSTKMTHIDRYLMLLKALEIEPQKLNFRLRVRQDVQDEIMKRLAKDDLRSKGYLVVAPGGGETFSHKKWNYYSEFLKLFCEKTGLPVLLLGSTRDLALEQALTHVAPSRIKSWIGKTTHEEALAVVAESYAFLGGDTGLSHIAGSVGVPSVVLYGPTSAFHRHPPGIGKSVVCISAQVPCSPCDRGDGEFDWNCKDNACMKSISPKQVWNTLAQISGLPA